VRQQVGDPKRPLAGGDKVVIQFSLSGTHRAPFAGIPATGRSVKVDGIIIHRLHDGLIVEDFAVRDTLGLMVQLGVTAPPGGPKS
jgi:predicted ester cyclase